jgi:ureidoacrylate peracid hydrolase
MLLAAKGAPRRLDERLSPERTALVVIDIQNDFCHADGEFGRHGYDMSAMPAMAARTAALLAAARERDLLIVFVRACYDEPVLGRPLAEVFRRRGFADSMCLEGGFGIDWYGGVEPRPAENEVVLTKHSFSAFADSAIDLYLRSNRIETVVLTGVVTSGCVESTARDAFFRDYDVVLAEDCVADPQAERHMASLGKLGQTFALVLPSAEIARVWAGAASNRASSWSAESKTEARPADLAAEVAPARSALLLLDLAAHGDLLRPCRERIEALLRAARAAGVLAIVVDTELPLAARSTRGFGAGARIAADTGAGGTPAGAHRLVKHRASAFLDTALDHLLRANGIRSLVVAGAETHLDVDGTAREAAMRDYHVVLAADCVAANAAERAQHEAALTTLGRHFCRLADAAAIARHWRPA